MPPTDESQSWKASLQAAVTTLIDGLKDAATLTVETRSIKLGDPESEKKDFAGKLVARTVIEIDGDTVAGLPVFDEQTGQINKELLELHNQNVDRALQYRSQLLASSQQLVKDLIELIKAQ